ncbi:MAG: ABC transporter substrate-binding protein [Burkholderiales bacterium]|nr:MAG: ABC transporter substrate-binding protein [Burkholderiales bacterium]
MERRDLLIAFVASLAPFRAKAQQANKVWRIGVLETTALAMNGPNFDALRRGLRELGYVEGKNLLFEYRSADGRNDRFAELAKELADMKVDLIVTRGTPATLAAKAATTVIPIVSTAISNPVRTGLVKSLAQPGGNVTGLEPFAVDLSSKRVELLRETFPEIRRIGVLGNSSNPAATPNWTLTAAAAQQVGVEAQFHDLNKREDLAPAFEALARQRVGALIVLIDGFMQAHREAIVELAAKHQLPALYSAREFVEAGGLMSYAVSYPALYFRAASYVDKILKGAKPADLPVEQPTKLELVINVKTAKALGVDLLAPVKLRVDEEIE